MAPKAGTTPVMRQIHIFKDEEGEDLALVLSKNAVGFTGELDMLDVATPVDDFEAVFRRSVLADAISAVLKSRKADYEEEVEGSTNCRFRREGSQIVYVHSCGEEYPLSRETLLAIRKLIDPK